MRKILFIFASVLIVVLFVAQSHAVKPGTWGKTPGLTDASNVTITGGNATGLTTLGTTDLTVSGAANVTGATWTGFAGDTTGNAATSTTATTANALATNATGTNLSLGGVVNVTGLATLSGGVVIVGTANVTDVDFTGLTVGSVSGAAASADLAEDLSTASHSIYKDSAGNITNIITAIDASAANTTIDLIPGICATIHNYEQGDANAVSTLPAIAEGLCFTGLVTTTEDDKTFRLNAAAANTICLGATCGKDDIGFATGQNIKGGMFKCIAIAEDWFCHTITGTVDAGDL